MHRRPISLSDDGRVALAQDLAAALILGPQTVDANIGIHAKSPSSGFLTLVLALGVCDQVDVYGMTLDLEAEPLDRCAKYYDDKPWCTRSGAYFGREGRFHNWPREAAAMRRLRQLKVAFFFA